MNDADKFKERVRFQLNSFETQEAKEVRVSAASVKRGNVRRSIEDIKEAARLKKELEL